MQPAQESAEEKRRVLISESRFNPPAQARFVALIRMAFCIKYFCHSDEQ
jgi:hypothetical protein